MRVGLACLALLLVAGCGVASTPPAEPPAGTPAAAPGSGDGGYAHSPPPHQESRPEAGPRDIRCARIRCVALTFDDGPGSYTPRVLDLLARHRARATFFLVGEMIDKTDWPVLRRMAAEGHELGNHTWDHHDLTSLGDAALRREIVRTQRLVREVTGVRMRGMRPPYGATDGRVAREARRLGLGQVLWAIDTLDWRDRVPKLVVRRSTAAKPGEIVLMHDIHKTTVDALPRLLDVFDKKGFTYVTVSELFGDLKPGKRYSERKPRTEGKRDSRR
ncbi:polysaccharide deacetylase family protein [Microtetraspora niveoalba]|uniref:polysaccharide deacetylase family protein n=1 Tax=Microtetraspora niveoalba TaxID=46175 RepID=UPI00082A3E13|nr:polysaccharide deacetylase family protein [Microtetraspora niveoalba]